MKEDGLRENDSLSATATTSTVSATGGRVLRMNGSCGVHKAEWCGGGGMLRCDGLFDGGGGGRYEAPVMLNSFGDMETSSSIWPYPWTKKFQNENLDFDVGVVSKLKRTVCCCCWGCFYCCANWICHKSVGVEHSGLCRKYIRASYCPCSWCG